MRIPWKGVGIAGLVIIGAIQFVRPNRTNPPVDPSQGIQSHIAVPDKVSAIFQRACRDCHTNETVWPWYSQIAPVSWILAGHVRDGRSFLNLSEWSRYTPAKGRAKLDQICENVSSGKMPLASYRPFHPDARLSKDDVRTLCEWTRQAIDAQLAPAAGKGDSAPAPKR